MGPEELESSFAGFLGLRVEADDEEDEEDEEIQLVRTRSDLSVCDWYEGRFFFHRRSSLFKFDSRWFWLGGI